MSDTRKEQKRDELHRAIWAIADELRGSVDGWDFKSYVLGSNKLGVTVAKRNANLVKLIEGVAAMGLHNYKENTIDASGECVKVTNNNKLTEENIAKIVAEFVSHKDVDYFARCVPYDEIAGNDYNLSVSTYVEDEDTREVIDIVKLNAEIREIVAREQV